MANTIGFAVTDITHDSHKVNVNTEEEFIKGSSVSSFIFTCQDRRYNINLSHQKRTSQFDTYYPSLFSVSVIKH